MVKEFSEDACAETASEPNAVGSKDTVRLYIAGEAKDQGGGGVDDVLVVVRRELAVPYRIPDRIEDQVGGDLGVGLRNFEQEAILGKRPFVVLFG